MGRVGIFNNRIILEKLGYFMKKNFLLFCIQLMSTGLLYSMNLEDQDASKQLVLKTDQNDVKVSVDDFDAVGKLKSLMNLDDLKKEFFIKKDSKEFWSKKKSYDENLYNQIKNESLENLIKLDRAIDELGLRKEKQTGFGTEEIPFQDILERRVAEQLSNLSPQGRYDKKVEVCESMECDHRIENLFELFTDAYKKVSVKVAGGLSTEVPYHIAHLSALLDGKIKENDAKGPVVVDELKEFGKATVQDCFTLLSKVYESYRKGSEIELFLRPILSHRDVDQLLAILKCFDVLDIVVPDDYSGEDKRKVRVGDHWNAKPGEPWHKYAQEKFVYGYDSRAFLAKTLDNMKRYVHDSILKELAKNDIEVENINEYKAYVVSKFGIGEGVVKLFCDIIAQKGYVPFEEYSSELNYRTIDNKELDVIARTCTLGQLLQLYYLNINLSKPRSGLAPLDRAIGKRIVQITSGIPNSQKKAMCGRYSNSEELCRLLYMPIEKYSVVKVYDKDGVVVNVPYYIARLIPFITDQIELFKNDGDVEIKLDDLDIDSETISKYILHLEAIYLVNKRISARDSAVNEAYAISVLRDINDNFELLINFMNCIDFFSITVPAEEYYGKRWKEINNYPYVEYDFFSDAEKKSFELALIRLKHGCYFALMNLFLNDKKDMRGNIQYIREHLNRDILEKMHKYFNDTSESDKAIVVNKYFLQDGSAINNQEIENAKRDYFERERQYQLQVNQQLKLLNQLPQQQVQQGVDNNPVIQGGPGGGNADNNAQPKSWFSSYIPASLQNMYSNLTYDNLSNKISQYKKQLIFGAGAISTAVSIAALYKYFHQK